MPQESIKNGPFYFCTPLSGRDCISIAAYQFAKGDLLERLRISGQAPSVGL
jgi:hypothetical protein